MKKNKLGLILLTFFVILLVSILINFYFAPEKPYIHQNKAYAIEVQPLFNPMVNKEIFSMALLNKEENQKEQVMKENQIIKKKEYIEVEIPFGKTVDELADYIEDKGISTKKEFYQIINDKNFYKELQSLYSVLPDIHQDVNYLFEGYLYGGTYNVSKDNLLSDLIEKQVQELQSVMESLEKKFPNGGKDYSLSEKVIIASIIDKEAYQDQYQDKRAISSVFYNRLKKGMKIQSDVTVQYALDKYGERVLYADLKHESLYNTYFVEALPIAPIDNPSYESILATFNPKNTSYYFFFGVGKKTYFSGTFEEHKKTIAKFR